MPVRTIELFSPAQRGQAYADFLSAAPAIDTSQWHNSRVAPAYTLAHGLVDAGAKIGNAWMAKRAEKKAESDRQLEEALMRIRFGQADSPERRQAYADAIMGAPPRQSRERAYDRYMTELNDIRSQLDAYAEQQSRMPLPEGLTPEMAMDLYQRNPEQYYSAVMDRQEPERPNVGAVDPSKFTPESVQRFNQSGDYGVLAPIPESGDTGRSLSELLSTEEGLRKEFTSVSDDFRTLAQKYTNIQAAAQNPSAAGDLSIIFSYMKILDPTSVVREGEQATARNAAGVPEQVRNIYNRLMTGEQLTPDQRADFVSQAGQLFSARRSEQDALIQQYSDIARRAGVNVDNVILEAFRPQAQAPNVGMPDFRSMSDEDLRRLADSN